MTTANITLDDMIKTLANDVRAQVRRHDMHTAMREALTDLLLDPATTEEEKATYQDMHIREERVSCEIRWKLDHMRNALRELRVARGDENVDSFHPEMGI